MGFNLIGRFKFGSGFQFQKFDSKKKKRKINLCMQTERYIYFVDVLTQDEGQGRFIDLYFLPIYERHYASMARHSCGIG